MRLSVVLITWNEKGLLKTCLDTVFPAIDQTQDEVVIIDNGSVDGTDEMVRNEYPQARYLKLDRNIGVGPARNRGICLARGDYIMTLDNDTRVFGNDLGGKIQNIFAQHPEIGLFSFRLLNEDGSVQRNTRRYPNILQPLCARIGFIQRSKLGKRNLDHHLMADIDLAAVNDILDVDYVLGANQVFRKESFVLLNGYDEAIFFGPEDADFCLRIRRLGLRVCYIPQLNIEHAHRRRTRKFSMLTVKHIIHYYYLFWKEKSLWGLSP
ncbi:glycosyltransferase [Insolitispirillum peregrinum]|uniref:glycosyltransferase n=1 Tax=Insolitispirillum peregrinum TaxID=80876 RepID=UPI00360ECB82